ncbi:MAG: hypothetical protein FWC72_02415 [Oscillospiraceae bacterium]|nr:hypothetical protein [Oscillospiraceae bacterium]
MGFWKKKKQKIRFDYYSRIIETAVKVVRKFGDISVGIRICPCDFEGTQKYDLSYIKFAYYVCEASSSSKLVGSYRQHVKEYMLDKIYDAVFYKHESTDHEDNGFRMWAQIAPQMFLDGEERPKHIDYATIIYALEKHTPNIEGVGIVSRHGSWEEGFHVELQRYRR